MKKRGTEKGESGARMSHQDDGETLEKNRTAGEKNTTRKSEAKGSYSRLRKAKIV